MEKKPLETFIMSDQPATCPTCGSRTDFKEVKGKQLHNCRFCGKRFWMVKS